MSRAATEIVRASGFCVVCEYRFTDEVVARFPARSLVGGYGYVELRHLRPEDRLSLLCEARTESAGGAQTHVES